MIKKSKINLTHVPTPTQEKYNTSIQLYECNGWKLKSLPGDLDYLKGQRCVDS